MLEPTRVKLEHVTLFDSYYTKGRVDSLEECRARREEVVDCT